MPYVNIKITKEGNVTPEQKRALIEGATNLLHDVLGKNKSTTVVTIDEVDTDNWGIGGVPVTEIRKGNLKAEKFLSPADGSLSVGSSTNRNLCVSVDD